MSDHVLERFAAQLYTPERHQEMVEALVEAGYVLRWAKEVGASAPQEQRDDPAWAAESLSAYLDSRVQEFANLPADVSAHVLKRAKELRAAHPLRAIP